MKTSVFYRAAGNAGPQGRAGGLSDLMPRKNRERLLKRAERKFPKSSKRESPPMLKPRGELRRLVSNPPRKEREFVGSAS